MNSYRTPGISLRILLILAFLSLARISPRPHEVDHNLNQARLARQAGEVEAYAYYIAQAAEQLPSRIDLWEMAGRAALQAGKPQITLNHLEKASRWGELSPESRLCLGDAYQALGDVQRAIQIWQQEDTSPDAFARLAQAHLSLRDYSSAVADLEAELRLRPNDPQAFIPAWPAVGSHQA